MTKPNQEEKHDRHAGHGSATHNEQMKKHGAGELVSVVEAEEGELMRRLALSRKGKLGS